jgi:Domain of unknown function (DUF4167)
MRAPGSTGVIERRRPVRTHASHVVTTVARDGATRPTNSSNHNATDDMRTGSDQRPRGRYNGNRPSQSPRVPQHNHTFDSNGPDIKIRGSAHQIFERYVALAREAMIGDDRVAAENLYQHAEHYFRINNASREGNQQGTPPRPTSPSDVEMNPSAAELSEVQVDRSQPRWDGNDPVSSETSVR